MIFSKLIFHAYQLGMKWTNPEPSINPPHEFPNHTDPNNLKPQGTPIAIKRVFTGEGGLHRH